MAAVLACGENACLSHRSAGALYSRNVGTLHRIPITSPVQTMIDLASELSTKH